MSRGSEHEGIGLSVMDRVGSRARQRWRLAPGARLALSAWTYPSSAWRPTVFQIQFTFCFKYRGKQTERKKGRNRHKNTKRKTDALKAAGQTQTDSDTHKYMTYKTKQRNLYEHPEIRK